MSVSEVRSQVGNPASSQSFQESRVPDAQGDRSDAAQWRPQTFCAGSSAGRQPGRQHTRRKLQKSFPGLNTTKTRLLSAAQTLRSANCNGVSRSFPTERKHMAVCVFNFLSLNEAVDEASLLGLHPNPIANQPRSYGENGLHVSF